MAGWNLDLNHLGIKDQYFAAPKRLEAEIILAVHPLAFFAYCGSSINLH
jgi:hypothetical protein